MEFRDLKKQYEVLKDDIDIVVNEVMREASFISGRQVTELEKQLAEYVGVKHCITCANGTDALSLAAMVWNIGEGDAVFVPDFTFFSTGEIVAFEGATPIFVDIEEETFNMSPASLEEAIKAVLAEGKLKPKAVVPVDLFGLPFDYIGIRAIADRYQLMILEDAAQGFGGGICKANSWNGDVNAAEIKRACSFGDIATTSFFPAKPLGCYGDGGAIFTNNDEYAELLKSLRVHGKGNNKYDNVRLGMNSRLDTLQAAILQVKLRAFSEYELKAVNASARAYSQLLGDLVKTPNVSTGFVSSWAQYTILLRDKTERDALQAYLRENGIPSMIYYPIPMHEQKAFSDIKCVYGDLSVTTAICGRVLSLPMHPYLERKEQEMIVECVRAFLKNSR